MPARKTRIELDDRWKEKIKAGVIMDRLLKHVNGAIELSATQVNAANILLRKIVPDLSVTDSNVNLKGQATLIISASED